MERCYETPFLEEAGFFIHVWVRTVNEAGSSLSGIMVLDT